MISSLPSLPQIKTAYAKTIIPPNKSLKSFKKGTMLSKRHEVLVLYNNKQVSLLI